MKIVRYPLALVFLFAWAIALRAQASGDLDDLDWQRFPYLHCLDERRTTDERISACEAAIKAGRPYDAADALYELASLYLRDHDYSQALATADKYLDRYGRVSSLPAYQRTVRIAALQSRAIVYAVLGRFDDAMRDETEIAQLDVHETEFRGDRCQVRAVSGRELDEAIADCTAALNLEPGSADVLDSRGMAYFKLGRLTDSLSDYNSALDRDSHYWPSLFMRGVVERRLGDAAAGDADIAKAKARDAGIADQMAAFGVAP
ncbi:MAG: tetratricopeptide repeat protein [Rhizomicrobium sp.]